MPNVLDSRFRSVLAAALDLGRRAYADAIAGELLGEDTAPAWKRYRMILARSVVLSELVAAQRVIETSGITVVASHVPIRPMAFSHEYLDSGGDEGMVAGQFLEAIESFGGKVPRLRSTVEHIAKRAWDTATVSAEAEHRGALNVLANRSGVLQSAVRGSFWSSDSDLSTIVNMKHLLGRAIRGESVRGIPGFITAAQLDGARHLAGARLETIYRNNLHTAYADGQAETLSSPEVQRVVPLVELQEILDKRTRANHRAISGYINTITEIDRQGLRFPNGHNCRGFFVPVSTAMARQRGLVSETGVPDAEAIRTYNGSRQDVIDRGEYPDPGFRLGGAAA